MEIIGYIAALFIGLTLGLIGGGGSILTMPILVYLFKMNPEKATSYSLFIVGITSLLGAYKQYQLGNLKFSSAFYFGIPSLLSLLLTRKFVLPLLPHTLFQINDYIVTKDIFIMSFFAILMLLAAFSMIRTQPKEVTANPNFLKLILLGLGIGMVTGFLGAGGGFLIIPVLLFFAGLSMKQAIGNSLFIIFINSSIGFIGDVVNGILVDYTFLFSITFIACIGMLVGTEISKKTNSKKLKPAFGWFVLLMGIYIISKEFLSM